jgi:hypothetical protein
MRAGRAAGRRALACRRPAAIETDAARPARRLWQVMQDAWHARRGSDDRCRALA